LLSATVIAPDCMTADAYSTAIMAMGLDNAIKMLERNKYLDAYLVYSDEKGNWQSYSTGGIKEILEEMK
jgi:FAD:protein FMN transferase